MAHKETRTLYIVRHAKSSHDDSTLTDFERPLNDRGYRDAPKMGKRLNKMGVVIDHVLSSPSRRTTLTLEGLLPEIDFSIDNVEWDESIYLSSLPNLIERLRAVNDEHKNIILCGHNPSMTSLANYLQTDTIIENVVTTGIVGIEFECSWSEIKEGSGKFLFFDYPKKKQ